jgi:hypothetical protein
VTDRPPPWSSVSDVGKLGLETAAAVVERLLAVTRLSWPRQSGAPSFFFLPASVDGSDSRRMRADAERLIDLYAEWARALVDAAAEAAHPNGGSPDRLLIGPVAPDTSVKTTVWLHTLDGPATGPARLVATDLVAHHGGSIPSGTIQFDPAIIDGRSPRTSTEVTVLAAVPPETSPGPYHGHILADGLPELSLPLCVEVITP